MKKKNIAITAAAVTLAAALVLGGTYAYLTGSTGEEENDFSTNYNRVEITETTGGYDIVPGTSQDKNPTITATYTLDSYVFVEVTDATEDLVTWYIANGWTLLSDATTTTTDEDGNVTTTTYVYYQLLKYDESSAVDGVCTTELGVLAGDKVYYSASLTNSDMENAENISLTFKGYIIQAEPFADAANAWLVVNNEGVAINDDTGVVYTDSVATAINEAKEGQTVRLLADQTIEDDETYINVSMTLELDSYTLNVNHIMMVEDADLVLRNGTLNSTTGIAQYYDDDGKESEYYGTGDLTLTNVDLVVSSGTGIQFNTGTVTIDATSSVTSNSSVAIMLYPHSGDETAVLNVYGTVETKAKSTAAISGNGTCSWDNATEINIYEGASVKSSYPAIAIYHPQNGTLNVHGGTISGYCGIGIANGTLNVYGGTIEGTQNDTVLPAANASGGLTYDGSAIIFAVGYGDITANISGGTIQSTYSYGLRSYTINGYSNNATVNVTGGTITGGSGATSLGSYVTLNDTRTTTTD